MDGYRWNLVRKPGYRSPLSILISVQEHRYTKMAAKLQELWRHLTNRFLLSNFDTYKMAPHDVSFMNNMYVKFALHITNIDTDFVRIVVFISKLQIIQRSANFEVMISDFMVCYDYLKRIPCDVRHILKKKTQTFIPPHAAISSHQIHLWQSSVIATSTLFNSFVNRFISAVKTKRHARTLT
jgi:hypothetical protein